MGLFLERTDHQLEKRFKTLKENSWINRFESDIPGLTHDTFFSRSMKRDVGFAVYLPPDYISGSSRGSHEKKNYPVIYWLHGKGGDESTGFRVGIPAIFHKAITVDIIGPAIMVFPNCGNYSMFSDSFDRSIMGETILVKELIPLIDATYKTIGTGKCTGIEGFSMGGFGAIKLAFKYPEIFSTAVAYAGSFHDLESVSGKRPEVFEAMFGNNKEYFQKNSPYILAEKNREKIKSNLKIKMINGSEDFTLQNNYNFNKLLDELGIIYEFKLINSLRHQPFTYYDLEGVEGFKFHFKDT